MGFSAIRVERFLKSRFLYIFRPLTAGLCIAALLFSNVAGWLHVGCADAGRNCCSAQATEDVETKPHTTSCCHSSHGHADTHRTGEPHSHHCADETSETGSEPDHDHAPVEHDHERCSICQNFFTLRNGVVTTAVPTIQAVEAVEVITDNPARIPLPSLLLDSISVRGPPQV